MGVVHEDCAQEGQTQVRLLSFYFFYIICLFLKYALILWDFSSLSSWKTVWISLKNVSNLYLVSDIDFFINRVKLISAYYNSNSWQHL